ncbi:MAG: DUF418 domain-containing protein [Sphingomonas sp.]|nr:DUF418 domain-containing protein [Sphingomonas sp.]
MGILLANIAAFALPAPAYFSPLAWGGHGPREIAAWLVTFVFVEGKMRGLFSFLFGASMLLVIERAKASGQSPITVHVSRMAALFLFGLAHMYFVWWGDILAHYALVGLLAFAFSPMRAEQLLAAALSALVVTLLWNGGGLFAMVQAAPRSTPQAIETWNTFAWGFGVPPADWLRSEIAAMRGPWTSEVAWRWEYLEGPIAFVKTVGPETLTAMLFGMWGFRSGFLTGSWEQARYRKIAFVSLGSAWAAYLLIGLNTIAQGFDQRWVYFGSIVGTVPFRILGTVGYAALVILAIRPSGWLTERMAAVGRAAFTNYLGTSILVTAIFYGWGLGQFARWDRATIYLVPPLVWLIMLFWSKPWLDRFRYGPFEWLWRSLARLEPQTMRKPLPAGTAEV